jgi:luciferase family oxidoreductase group 1
MVASMLLAGNQIGTAVGCGGGHGRVRRNSELARAVGTDVRISILDRSNVRAGEPEAAALRGTLDRARAAERLGYHRFWVAEHHAVPGIAGSAPAVLVGAVAAATERIRVGSGGVMLPNHQPLVVAEQFATLEALHPGRVDLGLGRSVGFTPAVRAALREDKQAADRFEDDLAELEALLHGTAPVTARPRDRGATPMFVLATGSGVDIAARRGLPVVLGGPVLVRKPEAAQASLDRYRSLFRPGGSGAAPYVVVAVNVMVAGSGEEARDLLLPEAWAMAQARTRGEFPPLEPVAEVQAERMTPRQESFVEDYVAGSVHGTAAAVVERLEALLARTGADEVLLTGSTYDRVAQTTSDAALAAAVRGQASPV